MGVLIVPQRKIVITSNTDIAYFLSVTIIPKLRGDFSSLYVSVVNCSPLGLCPILQPYNGHVLQVHSLTSALCPLQQSRHFCLIALTGVNLAIFYLFLFARRRQQVPTLGYSPKNIVSLRRFRASI